MPGSRIEDHRFFPLLLIAASLAFSALSLLRDPLIDEDGVLYLVVARNFAEHGMAGAFELLERPLYPALIALLHMSGLSLLVSAQLLDAAFLALMLVCFSRLVATLGADSRLAGWAALLLLLLPQLNAYRSSLLPEFGCWSLLLVSWMVLLRYQQSRRWSDALAWAALGIAAAALRIEALVFALLLPALLSTRKAPLLAARLYACLGLLALVPLLVLARLGMLQEMLDGVFASGSALADGIVHGFAGATARYAEQVLGAPSDFAAISLAAGLLALLALEFARALGAIHCGLLIWSIAWHRAGLPEHARPLMRGALLCAVLILAGLLLQRRAVQGRDLLVLCMLALVPCTLALRSLADRARDAGRMRLFGGVTGLAIVLLASQGFISFGTRTTDAQEAVAWMDAHIESDASVFANDRILAWYSGARFDWTTLMHAEDLIGGGNAPVKGVDYWLIRDTGDNRRLAPALARYAGQLELLADFDGSSAQRIRIYRVRAPGGDL